MCLLQSLAGRATAAFSFCSRRSGYDSISIGLPRVQWSAAAFHNPSICENCRTSVRRKLWPVRICGEALDIDMESARFASQSWTEGLLCDDCRNRPPKFERAVAYAVLTERTARDDSPAQVRADERRRQAAWPNAGPKQSCRSRAWPPGSHRVPVPLFPSKLRQRGYNQSELLAKTLWPKCNGLVQIAA